MILPIFHFSVFSLNLFTLWYDQKYVEFPFSKEIEEQNLPFKSRILFLTMWCLALQTLYFAIAFLNDLFGSNAPKPKKTSLLRVTKDTLFSLAFPIALYVFSSFWTIYSINRDLIFPDSLAKVFPVWANQVMHTFIAPFVVLELLLSHRSYPTRKVGISMALMFTMSYLVVLNICYLKTGVWVYPFLHVLQWPVRIAFFTSSVGAGVGMYFVGEKLNSMVSPSSKEGSEKMKHR